MCIRDRFPEVLLLPQVGLLPEAVELPLVVLLLVVEELPVVCLLYTSDAADDLLCVDLGGRRIIK